MAQINEIQIDNFDGGIVNDPRDSRENVCRIVNNFQIGNNPNKLTPYRSAEDGDSASTTKKIQNFAVAYTGSVFKLFGLGVVSGTGRAEIHSKSLSTGGSSDLSDNGWASPSNQQSASGATSFKLFTYYQKTGLIYGAKSGTTIWAFDPTGVAAFADSHRSLTYTDIAEGLVHSKDDILYIPYDNKIAKNDNGSWTDVAITIPTHYKINVIAEFGNYLAIGAVPKSGVGESVVYLWDRDASLATLSESIRWGGGELRVLGEVEGSLIGISLQGGNSDSWLDERIVFRQNGKKFMVLESENLSSLPNVQRIIDNKLHFMMAVKIDGVWRHGVWSIGKTLLNSPFALSWERSLEGNTEFNGAIAVLNNFFYANDFLFQSFVDDSSNYQMSKTNDQNTYSDISAFETIKLIPDKQFATQQLLGVSVTTEYLPSGAQVVVKYKKDNDTSWSTILTGSTDGDIRHSSSSDSSGSVLPQFKEIAFRIESTGNAVITGIKIKSQNIEDLDF